MKAVILAGGRGTRISEESQTRPKPMVEIGGRPILWHIMKIYGAAGITDFIILLGYKGYMIKEYFANYFLHTSDVTIDLATGTIKTLQSKTEPWSVTLLDTGADTMTGGRLLRAKDYIGDETFSFTYGDGVTDLDIRKVIEFHRKSGASHGHGGSAARPLRNAGLDEAVGRVSRRNPRQRRLGEWRILRRRRRYSTTSMATKPYSSRTPLEPSLRRRELSAYQHRGFWLGMDTLWDKIQPE